MNFHSTPPVKLTLALATVVAVAVIAISLRADSTPAGAQGGASLALDADASNGSGACSPVDSRAEYADGEEFQVAVCLTNSGDVPLAAYQFRVTYDDRLIIAPEVADAGEGLDDNPDANAGSSTFSSPTLGGGWDCTAGVGAYPAGDEDGQRNGTGVAWSGGCGSVAPGGKSFTQGPIAVIRFRGEGGGEARLTPTNVSITDDNLGEVGSCSPGVDAPMDCDGATIVITGAPVPGVTPGAVITPGTPSPAGGTPVPPDNPTAVAAETALAVETAIALGTPAAAITAAAAGSTPDASETGTPEDDDRTRTPTRTSTPRAGTTQGDDANDDDDGGDATMWIIIGAVAAAVVLAGGGAAYWFRMRNRVA